MKVLNDKNKCCGCQACFNACNSKAIEMKYDDEGFLYPFISDEKCVQCGRCKAVCPIFHKPDNNPLELAYGCYAKNQDEHKSSSSGGIFSVIAREVLANGGVICGAAYDYDQLVNHIIIDNEDNLKHLKETKYVQSSIGDVYQTLQCHLKTGRQVLFSGVPCQVAGLKSYLNQDYDNLFCIDLICHGVPSPVVWKQYQSEISPDNTVRKVTFRNKEKGISNITVDYTLDDGQIIQEKYNDSLYIKGFLQNLFLRPSCFQCQFKGTKRCSDMTIGDFWAVKEYHPEQYQDQGVSAVIIHNEKAQALLSKVNDKIEIVEAATGEIACWNECLLSSVSLSPKREMFYQRYRQQPLLEIIKDLTEKGPKKEDKVPTASRLKNKVKRWFK